MPIPFNKILKYAKSNIDKNKSSNIITTLPNESVLAAKDKKPSSSIDLNNSSKKEILMTYLNMDEETAENIANQTANNYKMANVNNDDLKKIINAEYKKIRSINPKITDYFMSNKIPAGIGPAELLIKYIFDDSKISGGKESYDFMAGNKKFEVKSVKRTSPSDIRLGVEGSCSAFKVYNEGFAMFKTIMQILNFNKDKEMKILVDMLNSSFDKDVYTIDNIINGAIASSPSAKYSTIPEMFINTEIGSKNLADVNRVLNFYGKIASVLHKTKFEYVKLLNKNKIYSIKSIDDSDIDNIKIEVNTIVSKQDELNVIEIIHRLFMLMKKIGMINSSNDLDDSFDFLARLKQNVKEDLNAKFEKVHPLIVFNVNSTSDVCFGVFTNVELCRITQGGMKINAVS